MVKSFQRWRFAIPGILFSAARRVNIPAEVDARENCVFLRASRCLFTRRGTAATARYLVATSCTPSFFLIILHPTPQHQHRRHPPPPSPSRSFTDSPGASNNVASQPFHPRFNHLSLLPSRHLHRALHVTGWAAVEGGRGVGGGGGPRHICRRQNEPRLAGHPPHPPHPPRAIQPPTALRPWVKQRENDSRHRLDIPATKFCARPCRDYCPWLNHRLVSQRMKWDSRSSFFFLFL